ncbi:DUF4397 domain-containing protein [uncultured Friedmanniella sp.]|uniref:DUF4397 domain-containing protein n=1 Tax=uncultured Friedmanniella sp. TaxID=335381 RepID=UPI0035CA1BB1
MRRALLTGIAAASLLTALGTGAPPAQAASHHHKPAKAVVTILHAVPDTPVDVYVNHKKILDDFQPGTFSPSLSLKAGSYKVAITAATAKNDKNPIIGPAKYRFYPGHNYTVVAHLDAAGNPTATRYFNTRARSGKGNGRLIVRHDAAAPPVDIFADGALTMRHLTNPKQSKINVAAGTYSVAVALSGTTTPVIGPADVRVKAKQDTIVYAWGSAAAGNLTVAVQTVKTK